MKSWPCTKCSRLIYNKTLINDKYVGTSNRKYCLECSPFKSHNTKVLYGLDPRIKRGKTCSVCKEPFNDRHHKGVRCHKCVVKINRYKRKVQAVEYLGGKCCKCGWIGPSAAFEFHHINPEEKDSQIGLLTQGSWENIKRELDKCELVCSNCHRIYHSWHDSSLKEAIEEDIKNRGGIRLAV